MLPPVVKLVAATPRTAPLVSMDFEPQKLRNRRFAMLAERHWALLTRMTAIWQLTEKALDSAEVLGAAQQPTARADDDRARAPHAPAADACRNRPSATLMSDTTPGKIVLQAMLS